MPLISKPNYNQIFASQAPDQDKPAVFNNYPEGWGPESRPNNGKPTIKGFNYLQQTSDLKDLWILQNGAALPYDATMEYAEGAVVVKDGELQQWKDGAWVELKPLPIQHLYELLISPQYRTTGTLLQVQFFYLNGHMGERGVGGVFYWDALCPKENADGGNIIDPDNLGTFTGAISQLSAYLEAQGTGIGSGCFIRLKDTYTYKYNLLHYGMVVYSDYQAAVSSPDAAGVINYVNTLLSGTDEELYLAEGMFRLGTTARITQNCDFGYSTAYVGASANLEVVFEIDPLPRQTPRKVKLPKLQHTQGHLSDFSSKGVAIQVKNAYDLELHCDFVRNFKIGLELIAHSAGLTGCTFFINRILNTYGGVRMQCSDDGASTPYGWITENDFYINHISAFSEVKGTPPMVDSYIVQTRVVAGAYRWQMTENRFHNTTMEGGVHEWLADFEFASRNSFYNCRLENAPKSRFTDSKWNNFVECDEAHKHNMIEDSESKYTNSISPMTHAHPSMYALPPSGNILQYVQHVGGDHLGGITKPDGSKATLNDYPITIAPREYNPQRQSSQGALAPNFNVGLGIYGIRLTKAQSAGNPGVSLYANEHGTIEWNKWTTDTTDIFPVRIEGDNSSKTSKALHCFANVCPPPASRKTGVYDTTYSIGQADKKWDNIYAETSSITTSDKRNKVGIDTLSEAELRVSRTLRGMVRKYKLLSAYKAKGDAARVHVGLIAQDVQAVFIDEGLNPNDYALFCADDVLVDPDYYDKKAKGEDVPDVPEMRTVLGLRYEELLCFIIASL